MKIEMDLRTKAGDPCYKENMKTMLADSNEMVQAAPARSAEVRGWQRWAPYAAVAWSLVYSALGIYWAVSGRGFPYQSEPSLGGLSPLAWQFGPVVAWILVILAGIPAAALGMAMLRGVRGRALRLVLIMSEYCLPGAFLLLMTDINLLIMLGYLPYAIRSLFTNAVFSQGYFLGWTQWATLHQLLCLAGGFLWLAGTVSYSRQSGDACLYCGRRNGPEGWQAPNQAARWGRVAVLVALARPIFYTITRYAWALGIPLGISEQALRLGQENGTWTSGLFLATFGLVGAVLMLGLVQRWGEVFPRWIIGLAGRRVPIALAVVPASLVSVLLIVGGITMWSAVDQMSAASLAGGADGIGHFWEMFVMVGPSCCSQFGARRWQWRLWATTSGGADRAACAVAAQTNEIRKRKENGLPPNLFS